MMLRMLKEEDADGMLEWMRDPEICKNFRFSCENMDRKKVMAFIHDSRRQFKTGINRHYAIVDEDDVYLGTISLKEIDMASLNAEFAISMRRKAQGKGIAESAVHELLDIAFNELGLERVYLNVLSDNERAIRLYEKCGFMYEGEFRNHLFLGGEFKMLKWYGILKEEYFTLHEMRGGGSKKYLFF